MSNIHRRVPKVQRGRGLCGTLSRMRVPRRWVLALALAGAAALIVGWLAVLVRSPQAGIAPGASIGVPPAASPSEQTSAPAASEPPRAVPAAGPAPVSRDAPRNAGGSRILVIGLDAADWAVLEPLIDRGDLPNLKQLVARGASGVLRSEEPMLSPILWTTIATGREPLDHGILDFVEADADSGDLVPVSARQRRVPAVWDLVSAAGLDICLIAWWGSWPAYPLHGRVVSDRVAFSAFAAPAIGADSRGDYFPDDLAGRLSALRVPTEAVGRDDL